MQAELGIGRRAHALRIAYAHALGARVHTVGELASRESDHSGQRDITATHVAFEILQSCMVAAEQDNSVSIGKPRGDIGEVQRSTLDVEPAIDGRLVGRAAHGRVDRHRARGLDIRTEVLQYRQVNPAVYAQIQGELWIERRRAGYV